MLDPIKADQLACGDIIDSHDDEIHEVVRVEHNDHTEHVTVSVQRGRNDHYQCVLEYDADINVLL